MKKVTFVIAAMLFTLGAYCQAPQEARFNAYGKQVNRQLLTAEERDGILTFESKNQNYKFWLDNRVQVDGAKFFHNDLNQIGDGVILRRVRFAVKAKLHDKWYGEIDMQVAGGSFELEDAYLKYVPIPELSFKLGNFKEAFSMQSTTTSRYLTFMERSMAVNVFSMGRRLGFLTEWERKYFLLQGGVFFQEIKSAAEDTAVQDASKKGVSQGIAVNGRLAIQPVINDVWGLHAAVAVVHGQPTTDVYGSGHDLSYGARPATSVSRIKYMNYDIADVHRYLLMDYELAGYYGPAKLQGEYISSKVSRTKSLPTLNFSGFYVQGSVMLFGGKPRYNKGEGEFTSPSLGRKWGDIELAARYGYTNLNDSKVNVNQGSADEFTIGANYYINSNVKIMLNYSLVNNDVYAGNKGKLNVGYDLSGAPTKDPLKVVGKQGFDFSVISMRFELDF